VDTSFIRQQKATIGPNKIFFGLYEQRQPTRVVLGSTQLQTGQIHFMTHTICHNWQATSDVASHFVQRDKAAGTSYDTLYRRFSTRH
jgi:hypothetical protein